MGKFVPDGMPLPDNYLRAIGWVTATFASLDMMVNVAIWSFLGMTFDDGRHFTGEFISLDIRLKILNGASRAAIPDGRDREEFEALLAEMSSLNKRRNNRIHWPYALDQNGDELKVHPLDFKQKTEMRFDRLQHVPVTEIEKLALDIQEFNRKWLAYLARLSEQRKFPRDLRMPKG